MNHIFWKFNNAFFLKYVCTLFYYGVDYLVSFDTDYFINLSFVLL